MRRKHLGRRIIAMIALGMMVVTQTAFAAEEIQPNQMEMEEQQTVSELPNATEEPSVTETDVQPYKEEVLAEQESISGSEWIGEETETQAEPETGAEPETEAEQPQIPDGQEETVTQTKSPYWTELPSTLVTGLDFSSGRIVVGTDDASIFVDESVILSSYNGLYLLQFEDEHTARQAYLYYYDKADLVDIDNGIRIADGEEADERVQTETVMTAEENPFTELSAALETEQAQKQEAEDAGVPYEEPAYDIALIDTGVSEESGIDRMTLIGGDGVDDNGHGTKMAETILAQNPDAKILSIKVLDGEGKGDITAVYVAVQYAIEHNIPVINLSISARASQKNSILEEAIRKGITESEDEAKQKITVVGAAGNHGKNAKYYVPGRIEAALIVGAADKDGTRLELSNYGETVDYNVVAESTSEAAALTSGFVSLHGMNAIEETVGQDLFLKEDRPIKEPEAEETAPDKEREISVRQESLEEFDGFEASDAAWTQEELRMEYSGGAAITSKLQENANLFDNKIALFTNSQITNFVAGSAMKRGYIYVEAASEFREVYYVEIAPGYKRYSSGNPRVRYYTDDLNILVTIEATDSNKPTYGCPECVYFLPDRFQIGFGETIYSAPSFSSVAMSATPGYTHLPLQAYSVSDRITNGWLDFVGFHLDVFEGSGNTRLRNYPEIFTRILDIDEGQSFKRLNNNEFTSKDIIRDKAKFDVNQNPEGTSLNLVSRTRSDSNGVNYFFSPVSMVNVAGTPTPAVVSNPNDANIYSRNKTNALLDVAQGGLGGIDYSFGWAKEAGSEISLFAPAGSLKIRKNAVTENKTTATVVKNVNATNDHVYEYQVSLKKADGTALSGSYPLTQYKETGEIDGTGTIADNGNGKLKIRAGWKAVIGNLPPGTKCTFTEFDASENPNDPVATGAAKSATIANGNTRTKFGFKVTLKNGNTPAKDVLVGIKDESGTAIASATTDTNGQITVNVEVGKTIELYRIPVNLTYTVEETDYSSGGYAVAGKANDTGTIKDPETNTIPTNAWTNAYTPSPVTVKFSTGAFYEITTEVENGTITDPIEGIPAGDDRMITYQPDPGYRLESVTVDGDAQRIEDYSSEYKFEDINDNHHIKVVYVPKDEPKPKPELDITKKAEPKKNVDEAKKNVYEAGETVTYKIELKQTIDGATATKIEVKDELPEGLTLVKDSIEGTGFTVVEANDRSYTLMVETLSDTLTYTYQAKTSKEKGYDELTNTVIATTPDVPDSVEDEETVKSVFPKPIITKSVSNETPEYGEVIEYTIVAEELQDDASLYNAKITDAIPEGIQLLEDTIKITGENGTAKIDNGVLIITPNTEKQKLDKTMTVTYKAKVTTAEGDVTNTAILTGTLIDGETPVGPVEDDADITVDPPQPDLTKMAERKEASVGERIAYTVTAETDSPLINAVLTDELPEGMEDVQDIECDIEDAEISYDAETRVITVRIPKVEESVTLTYTAKMAVDGELTNVVTLTADNLPEPVPDDETVIVKKPVPKIEKSVSKKMVSVGETVKYEIRAYAEEGTLLNAVVTDKTPAGIVVNESTITCSDKGADVSYKDGMLTAKTAKLGKEPMVITYEAKVTNAGLLTNVAEVTSDNYDGDPVIAKATVEAKDQPKTGDDSHLLLWMLLATAGLTGVTLIWLAVLRRKQKN